MKISNALVEGVVFVVCVVFLNFSSGVGPINPIQTGLPYLLCSGSSFILLVKVKDGYKFPIKSACRLNSLFGVNTLRKMAAVHPRHLK